MAVLDHHPVMSPQETNHCALMFCMTWVGFFVVIGLVGWLLSAL